MWTTLKSGVSEFVTTVKDDTLNIEAVIRVRHLDSCTVMTSGDDDADRSSSPSQ